MNKLYSSGFRVGGKVATLYFERGITYNALQILLDPANGLTKDLIREIRIRLNDKVIFQIDPARLDKIDRYKSRKAPAAFMIPVDFTEPDAKNAASEFAGIIGTANPARFGTQLSTLFPAALGVDVKDFRLEVEAFDASAPLNFLRCQYWLSQESPLSRRISTLIPRQIELAGAGVWDIELPYGDKSAHDIRRIWLFEEKVESDPVGHPGVYDLDPKKISKVLVRKNSVDYLDTERLTNEYDQDRYDGTPDDEFYCVDFGMANYNVQELFITQDATDCRLKVTTTGRTTVTYWIEAYSDHSLI